MTSRQFEAVVIGASAGALDALSAILPYLPGDFRMPVIIVVHVPPDRKSALAELFHAKCKMAVRDVEDKEPIESGSIYFAPPDYHLLVEEEKSLSLSTDDPVLFSRPSIDVLFESAADAFGAALIGIILSGANADGARGIRAIRDAGGVALVQSPDQAFARTMPEAAIAMCPTAEVMSLGEILARLQQA